MNAPNTYTFPTAEPVKLEVEVQSGEVTVTAADTDTTTVEVTGKLADETTVEQQDDQITVTGPRSRSLFGNSETHVKVTVPTGSQFRSKTGSGDITTSGTLLAAWCHTGSGDVRIETVTGPVQVKTGSGDIRVDAARESITATTGSGDLIIREASGKVVLKTGSGDATIGAIDSGQVEYRAGSGGLQVGIPSGTPVWTDVTTGSGKIRTDIDSVGEPADGQDNVRVRARTGSGNVTLMKAV